MDIYTHIYMYAHNGMLSGHQKEISLFTTTWMNLEGIMLSEKKKNTKWSHLYVDYKKQNKQYKMKTDSDTEKNGWCCRGEGRGRGEIGEGNQEVQTSSFKIKKPQRYNMHKE
ncbi:unnamed protein product [Rangifer tarandus platyrhynchus]|uniref:Uncharacterized protein n=1 Tax=Rangifer tarandus platyrhynchus TaxID=3082113 RepID=A0AC59ZL51_RANTA